MVSVICSGDLTHLEAVQLRRSSKKRGPRNANAAESYAEEVLSHLIFSCDRRNPSGSRAGSRCPSYRRKDGTVRYWFYQINPYDDRADHLLHRGGGNRQHRRYAQTWPRGREGPALF